MTKPLMTGTSTRWRLTSDERAHLEGRLAPPVLDHEPPPRTTRPVLVVLGLVALMVIWIGSLH